MPGAGGEKKKPTVKAELTAIGKPVSTAYETAK